MDACFKACDLNAARAHGGDLVRGGRGRRLRQGSGRRLQAPKASRVELSKRLGAERVVVQANAELRKREGKMSAGAGKDFLKETIDCFEAGANRATIAMCWILAMDHLMSYVLAHHLPAFNVVLATNTDKRVKVSVVTTRDDFSDILEGKFTLRNQQITSHHQRILIRKTGQVVRSA